jgi:predicted  nucleic acid-binding Zn-ribbon protein
VYDLDTITEKEDAMRERFNEKKASDLRANNTKGMDLKEKMHELTDTLDAMDEDKKRLNTRLEELRNQLEGYPMKEEPDVEGAVKADAEMHNLQGEIDQVKAQIEESKKGDNAMELSDIKIKRSGLQGEIDALKRILSKRDDIKRNEERIEQLQKNLA